MVIWIRQEYIDDDNTVRKTKEVFFWTYSGSDIYLVHSINRVLIP
jgi:hypothetical protein